MNTEINIVELATALASARLFEEIDYKDAIVDESDDDISVYTEQAQKIFNTYYDYYYNILGKQAKFL
jgi:hypothetical protein